MKKILFLLLCTAISYGQTYQNPTFGTVKTKTAPTVTTTPYLGTVGTDGTISKITPENLPVSTATKDSINTKIASNAGLQNAYNFEPKIVTSDIKGSVAIHRGSAADTDNILVGKNGAGTTTFAVTGAGNVTGGTYNGYTPLSGSGTTNYLPKFTGSTALGNSNLSDNGTIVTSATDMSINGVRVGRGGGNDLQNVALGYQALLNNATGSSLTAIGYQALLNNTGGTNNVGIGLFALRDNTSGSNNQGFGHGALTNNTTGIQNTAVGKDSGRFTNSGSSVTIVNNSVFIGYDTRALSNSDTNEIVIGHQSRGLGSNTSVFGNSSTTFGRWWGRFLLGSSTDSGEQLQVTGSTKLDGTLKLPTTPTTSAGSYDILTRNSSTGVVEKVADLRPYKVYTALISQSGTSAPTATVLENTLGGTVVWSRAAGGTYLGTLAGVFISGKTWAMSQIVTSTADEEQQIFRNSSDNIQLRTAISGTGTDNLLNNTSIEIRVYN